MLHFAYQCHFQANNFIRGRGRVTCYFQFVGEKCDIQNKCHSISSIKIHAVSRLALENYRKAVLNHKRSNNNLTCSLTPSDPASVGMDSRELWLLVLQPREAGLYLHRIVLKIAHPVDPSTDLVFSQSSATCSVRWTLLTSRFFANKRRTPSTY